MSDIIKEGDKIIVKPGQDVVATMAEEFRNELKILVDKSPKELVIDLAGVEMVDSVGIGVLIATHNSVSKAGGKVIVINVSKNIYGLFKTMRLDQHFKVIMVEE